MSIAARCGDCQKLYKVDDKLAGKRVRCKACGGAVEVPAQTETRAAPATTRAPAGPVRAPAGPVRSPAAPSRKSAQRPAPPPADDDPFSNLDALMSLEGSGTVSDDPPPVRTSKPTRSAAAPSGDGILAPAPISLGIVVNGFGFADPTALSWVVMGPVMLGVLWLMFRLKPIPYLVSAAFSLVCAVGIPVMLILILVMAMGGGLHTFAALGNARANATQVKSASNLHQMGMAMALYANEHKGQYPRSLEDLSSVEGFNRAALNSPAGPKPYIYNYFAKLTSANAQAYMVAYDPNPSPYGGVECLFGDGHVDQLNPGDLEKAEQLNEQIRRGGNGGPIISPGSTRVPDWPRMGQPVDFAAHHAAVEASFQKIAAAIKSYAAAHRGNYPVNLFELHNFGLTNQDFYSPFGSPYVYVSLRGGKPPLPAKMVLAFEEGVRDNRRTVLWGDLHVETIGIENWDQTLSESVKLRSQLPR